MKRQLNITGGFAALALAMTVGCGSDRTEDVASDQEEIAAESELAIDELEAMADVADGDTTFAELVGAGEAGKDVLLEEGDRDPRRPLGPRPRHVRVHLGRLLRHLAPAGAFLCGQAATVERETADAGCELIGRGGQYLSRLAVTFDNCELPLGIKINGSVSVATTKALAAGATCDAAGLAVDVTHAVTLTGLRAEVAGHGSAEASGTASSHAVRGPGAPSKSREWRVDETRKLTDEDGTVRLDQHLFGSGSTALDESGDEPALVRNGMFTAELNLRGITVATTHTDVRRVRSCCHPIGGSIAVNVTGNREVSKTVAFGPTCGQATVDGEARELRDCR